MFGPDHYLSKIDRNASALPNVPRAIRTKCFEHIKWARELASKIGNPNYGEAEREAAINLIHQVMDEDYEKMGYELPRESSKGK